MKRWLTRFWKPILPGTLGLVVVAYLGGGILIGHSVNQAVAAAREDHSGTPVAALLEVVSSEHYSLKPRNRAIWALGQMGDPTALPALEEAFTGGPCDHDHELCQHELEKAIAACRGGINISSPIWRHGELAAR